MLGSIAFIFSLNFLTLSGFAFFNVFFDFSLAFFARAVSASSDLYKSSSAVLCLASLFNFVFGSSLPAPCTAPVRRPAPKALPTPETAVLAPVNSSCAPVVTRVASLNAPCPAPIVPSTAAARVIALVAAFFNS